MKRQPTDVLRAYNERKWVPRLFIPMICIANKNEKQKTHEISKRREN